MRRNSNMFTGIIEKTSKIIRVIENRMARRLVLNHTWTDLRPGESIAVNGVCLTVAEFTPSEVSFDVIAPDRAGLVDLLHTLTERVRLLVAGGIPPYAGPAAPSSLNPLAR